MSDTPEQLAHRKINAQLATSGMTVTEQSRSVVGELEAVVSAKLQHATRLRQSILQKQFTGKF